MQLIFSRMRPDQVPPALPHDQEDFELELAHGPENAPIYFNLDQESSGTRRLLLIMQSVFSALDAGSVVFIDELDASLHTQISEALLSLFCGS